jgi:hypothetical protein
MSRVASQRLGALATLLGVLFVAPPAWLIWGMIHLTGTNGGFARWLLFTTFVMTLIGGVLIGIGLTVCLRPPQNSN